MLRRAARLAPLVLATAFLAQRAIGGILQKLGHPGAALDDAYIHFQYARAFAEGHPFRFQAGEPISTGATSFLWPILLAPFYLIGFRGEAILWPAWAMSFVALGALAYETYLLAKPLAGRAAAIGGGAMTLAFGGLVWCAASGMEVVPFAWLLASASRRAAEWAEDPARRTKRNLFILIAFAVASPLMRPEGALIAVALGAVVAVHPRDRAHVVKERDLSRAESLAFAVAAILPNLLLLLLTGSGTSSTAQVKLLIGNPYFNVADSALANAKVLVGTILNGEVWSAEFLPKGGAPIACLSIAALGWRGWATKLWTRTALVVLLAFMMFVPCVYVTFLWNRLRYLWPFAPGWFVGLACLARVVAMMIGRIDRRAATASTALLAGAFAGALAVRLDWVLEDVAQSASGIDRQQAALGRWVKTALPEDARVGVNDTGAIAYFGDRKTFDVVGLTSPTEGRYWVAGAASRLEHYERLHRTQPAMLPTHFIVYPEWMGLDPVLGVTLKEATVTDSTILGGQTMRASVARYQNLGTGEKPWTALATIADSLDVADLESEVEHRYELLGAREGEQTSHEGNAPSSGAIVVDGGRTNRVHERFVVRNLPSEGDVVGVARLEAGNLPSAIKLRVDGSEVAVLDLDVGPWQELVFPIPPEARKASSPVVELTSEAPFIAYHYWFGVR